MFVTSLAQGYIQAEIDWINRNNEYVTIPTNSPIVPIYSYLMDDRYDGNYFAICINKETRELYEISGSHCSCYGFEGQLDLNLIDIRMFDLKGSKYLPEIKELILNVINDLDGNGTN